MTGYNPRFIAFVKYYWPDRSPESIAKTSGWGVGFNLFIGDMKRAFFDEKYPSVRPPDRDLRLTKPGEFDAFIESAVKSGKRYAKHRPEMIAEYWYWIKGEGGNP